MKNNFLEKIKRVVLPPFSEIEAISVVYIAAIALFEYKDEGIETLKESFSSTSGNFILDLIVLFYLLYLIFKILYLMGKSAFSVKKLDAKQKRSLATTFYILSSLIIALASYEFILSSHNSIFDLVNKFILSFVFIRSVLTLSSSLAFLDFKPHFLTESFEEKQTSLVEVVLLFIIAPVFYFNFRPDYSLFTSVALTYFYTGTIIFLIRKLAPKVQLPHTSQ